MKNAIVIPCYNEAGRLKFDAFAEFLSRNEDFVICFVNDGSKDNSLELLRGFKARMGSQVFICNKETNGGKAEAVRSGFLYMLQYDSVEHIGFMDADLSTGFKDYMRLNRELEVNNLELVFGSRKLNNQQNIDRNPIRLFLSAVVGFMIYLILRLPIKDTQCGAKVFNRNCAASAFDRPFLTRWLFDVEIFIRLILKYGRNQLMRLIREIGLNGWEDVEGSKLSVADSLRIPSMLVKISYVYKIRPILSRAALFMLSWSWMQ